MTGTTPTPTRARRGRPGYDRDQVLEIAVQLFNERGYDATSVSDLAARLNLTKSALYHHFDSKEALLSEALESAIGGLEAVLDEARALDASATEQLGMLVRGAVDLLVVRLPAVTLLLRVRGNSPVEKAALERRRRFDQQVIALVARAQDEGGIRTDIDAAVATRLIFGMINSVVEWYRPGGPVDGATLGHDILEIALGGLGRQ
jgi:AcrR family transcriptional regulator